MEGYRMELEALRRDIQDLKEDRENYMAQLTALRDERDETGKQ